MVNSQWLMVNVEFASSITRRRTPCRRSIRTWRPLCSSQRRLAQRSRAGEI